MNSGMVVKVGDAWTVFILHNGASIRAPPAVPYPIVSPNGEPPGFDYIPTTRAYYSLM